jgi:hypothetical protein
LYSVSGEWGNDTDKGKLNYMEKTLASMCYSVHLKSYLDFPGIESGPLENEDIY